MPNNIFENFDIPQSDSPDGKDTDIDSLLENKKQKQKLLTFEMDSYFHILCHPFCITLLFTVLYAASLATKYIGIARQTDWLLDLSADLKNIVSYGFTIAATSIFTEFLRNLQNSEKQ